MMEEKQLKVAGEVSIMFLLILGGSLIGSGVQENRTEAAISDNIEYCEEKGMVLRYYEGVDGDLQPECFGELPTVDLHTRFENDG